VCALLLGPGLASAQEPVLEAPIVEEMPPIELPDDVEPPPDGAVPSAVLDAGRLRVLPQRHATDGAFAARFRRARA